MVEIDLKLNELTVPELLSAGSQLAQGLKDNESFRDPKPPLAELTAMVDALDTAQEEYRKLRLRLNELKTARDVVVKKLTHAIAAEAEYVQEASGGDAKKIMSANLHFEHKIGLWPFGGLDQVIELSASAGDQRREVDLAWDPVLRRGWL